MTTTDPTTTTPDADASKMNSEEMMRSLGGFEEIAIAQRFGSDLLQLGGTMATRALVFVDLRRRGAKDSEAYKTAMDMTLGDVQDRFVVPDEDEDGETGKDD